MITMIVRISALQIVAPDSRSQRELEKPQPRATGLTDEGLTIPIGRTDAEAQYFGHLIRRLTHWKRPCCWERLRAGGEGGDKG